MQYLMRIKHWLGPLWWYGLILFIVQRFGDVINAFVGLYLVPRYVSRDELGAVLPLGMVGSVLGLPLAILAVPLTKFLNTYAARGEFGKLKSMLQHMVFLSVILFVLALVVSHFVMPFVFTRMRVQDGSLGLLVVISGIIGALAPLFNSVLQALKKFRLMAVMGLFSAPIRLISMVVFMPFRALSGYIVGQTVPNLYGIFVSLFVIRKELGRGVKAESYLHSDWKPMIQYALPVSIVIILGVVQGSVENFVIRHRLPDFDSAGYYMISRFAEVGSYVGATFSMVLFPLVSEKHEQGGQSYRFLLQSLIASTVSGLFLTIFFYFAGCIILGLNPTWEIYEAYAPQMALLTAIFAIRGIGGCLGNYEMACRRFGFIYFCGAIVLAESILLYGLTGYSFFYAYLPRAWVDGMACLRASRLDFILTVMLLSSLLLVACMVLQLGLRYLRQRVRIALQ